MKDVKGLLFTGLVALIVCLSTGNANAQYPGINDSISKYRKGELVVKAKPGDKVQVEQLRHEFWFGCAISNSMADGSMSPDDLKQYKEKFLLNFNSAVTENAVKWPSMEREKGKVNYATVDGILKWTEENDIPLRAHNLFWGISQFIQPWVKDLSDNELRQTLQNRAETITARYKGRFAEYDLNNEMIHGNYYEDRLGPDITKLMAEWAHHGDCEARLYLNDYDILTGVMLPQYLKQIRTLLVQGVPIAGIGVQGHLHGATFDRKALIDALDSLSVFNLPIRVTEFNIPGQRSKFYFNRNTAMTPEEEEVNARELADYYRICFSHPAVEGIIMWGFWAGANWIPASSMYNRDWSATPTAKAYRDLVYHEWWTNTSGVAGTNGNFATKGFYGKYRVTVNGASKEAILDSQIGKLEVHF